MTTLRTAAALMTGGAVAATTLVSMGPSAGGAPAGPLSRFHQQRLVWKACTLGPDDQVGKDLDAAGARCADVTVPLDYSRPDGRTIKVAISRLKASGGQRRLGMMLINGGGPGPSLDMPPHIRQVMGAAGPRYDLVGMDPRSLGRSAPVDCGWKVGTWIKGAGTTRRSFEKSAWFAKDLADRCAKTNRALLPHISTRNIARDMDVVRSVLGERKMSYNGASYGTYLGAVYATMFPGRLDRVLLDSSMDPDVWGARLLAPAVDANEKALAAWAEWAAKRDAEYGLGDTGAEILKLVRRIHAVSGERPLKIGRYRVDATLVPVVLVDFLGTDEDSSRASLAGAVRVMREAAAGRPAAPTPDLADELAYLMAPTAKDARDGSGQVSLICGDVAAPRDPAVYWRDIRKHRADAPIFGALGHNIGPCAYWPTRPAETPTTIRTDLPALMVAATGDTRTTYQSNQALHRLLRGSKMITLDAFVHAPYQRGYPNACVRDRVNAYWLTGRLPGADLTCAPEH
ncbi:alpha/beta fold hydrolase [Actinomadura spongiicola]|uniref:Alpha/beta fold hydrolase n=1 Tax=Actinomadura spongiicola TaxID=2303421 RepID=A0A372GA02_9ACTN|nr:alpha/beta fold hydrolase [Actinomadura spongiicola]RFS81972.1 alpha/beta fold hydrolase [Actinomadura spongiicola]